jgi:Mn2+/Fe2+ NRAMP family transporter
MAGNNQAQQNSIHSSKEQMVHLNPHIEKDRESIMTARKKGRGAIFKTFLRLSGPGWLQSGITLGGVSFSSSLYLGVLVGFSFMWLQPLAMILGIIMLGAIAYVTLSTKQRPLQAINEHVNPVLGWSWLFASMAANLVWSMPQFALGTAAIQQNLLPKLVGPAVVPDPWGRVLVVSCFLAVCIIVTMFYGAGGRGVKIFEIIIKAIVSMIVLCFFGVVIKLTIEGVLDWGQIFRGLVPRLRLLSEPADTLKPFIEAVGSDFQQFWTKLIVSQQRDVMISAAAAAVGINMTFLLPYSMLRKGWDREFRGLAIFDLSTGLFIPFILATGFVVIASASRFHTVAAPGFVPETPGGKITQEPAPNLVGPYSNLLAQRLKFEIGEEALESLSETERQQRVETLPYADKKMAAMLVKRDNFNLADALAPLTGRVFTQYVFGLGVMGMGLSAATVLMAINGLCLCELLNKPLKGWTHRIGSLMISVGALGAIFWRKPAPWLAMPTSAFCIILLPIAYFAFGLLMNQKSILGDDMPRAGKRIAWNLLIIISVGMAAFISIWSLWNNLKWLGIAVFVAFITLVLVVHLARSQKKAT